MGGIFASGDGDIEQDLRREHENFKEIDMKWPYIILICINMLIILPISISMTYKYYILRSSYMYNARRPMLVITFNIVAIIFIGIYTPIHIIIMEIYWQNNAMYEEWWDSAFFFTTQICVFVTFALRTWHSFYDFKLAHSISNLQWRSILNERYRNQKQSFFLKYHKSLGKPRKTFLYFLIIPATVFLIIFIAIIAKRVGYDTEYLMLGVSFIYLLIAVFILMYIISHTWYHVYDNIHLRGEILIGCIVLCITVLLEGIIQCIDIYSYDVANEQYQQVFNFCFNIVTSLACFALIIVSTQYVRIKVNQNEKVQEEIISKLPTKVGNGGDVDENTWIFQDEVDFQALISTPDGLLEFLDHLAKEYELNYLVFAMEVTQYKTYVIPALMKRYKTFVQELESSLIEFPESEMPESTIIFPGEHKRTTERRMFMNLYEKYIDSSAEWRIKVSTQSDGELIELYRRCRMARTKAFSVYNRSMYDEDGNPTRNSGIFSNVPIQTMRTAPSYTEMQDVGNKATARSHSGSKVTLSQIDIKDLKAMVEALDGALNDVIETLKKSFAKYKMTKKFDLWFAKLLPKDREEMTRKYRHRQLCEQTIEQRENMQDCKQWECRHCTLINCAIYVDNKRREPKSICMCCGNKEDEKNVFLRTATSMHNYFRHSKMRFSTVIDNERLSMINRRSTKSKKQSINNNTSNLSNLIGHDTMRSMDSFDTEFKDDEINEIISPLVIEVNLDSNIVKLWDNMLMEIRENEEDNTCEGIESEYVDSCPKLQKLQFIMRCYNYYLGKSCECDKKGDIKTGGEYKIDSMAELINNLQDLNISKLLDIYQHVSTVHFEPDMFEYMEGSLGKCKGGRDCKPLSRNNGRRIIINRNDRNRNKLDVVVEIKEDEKEEKEEKEEEKYEEITRFRPLRRAPTVSKNINYIGNNGKKVDDEERITLSYLDKWHSFLFHPNVKQKQSVIIQEKEEEEEEEEDKNNDDDDDDDDDDGEEWVMNKNTMLGNNTNKFVTDASKYGSLSKVVSTKLNVLDDDRKNNNDVLEQQDDDETYYEYGYGTQIIYHTLSPHFVCMKAELIGNDVHTILDKTWHDTLSKALLCLEMESVEINYRANDHPQARQYGIKQNELIGVDNVMAILFYCNFDDLQREFSKTFRRINSDDTKEDIIARHCRNFYWFGRALFVAINFYGKRMNKNSVVWHGLSSKMLFTDFAAYFDCPTSTTTQKNVAQTFSGNGCGIILKLKSKHGENCAFMLDVSLFSDFTDECERLFLNETLIITDILTICQSKWISFNKYIAGCLYFNKITTGNANDNTWNIRENISIQNILAKIIIDYMTQGNINNINDEIPNYIRILFRHYCAKLKSPRFDDIDKIQYKMSPTLQPYLFDTIILTLEQYKMIKNKKQKISKPKIKLLFPNAIEYINDQKILCQMNDNDNNDENIINSPKGTPPKIDEMREQRSLSFGLKKKKKNDK